MDKCPDMKNGKACKYNYGHIGGHSFTRRATTKAEKDLALRQRRDTINKVKARHPSNGWKGVW